MVTVTVTVTVPEVIMPDVRAVSQEVMRAKEEHPRWPEDRMGPAMVLLRETGEAVEADRNRDQVDPPGVEYDKARLRREAALYSELAQVAATAVRWMHALRTGDDIQ